MKSFKKLVISAAIVSVIISGMHAGGHNIPEGSYYVGGAWWKW